jgi:PiT family inorganic phosphate transporter
MATAPASQPPVSKPGPVAVPSIDAKISKGPGKLSLLIFGVVLMVGVVYAGSRLISDLSGVHSGSVLPFLLLGLALLVALGFEFVNGFHDTANAVATVIYTHSLDPHIAVVWSGFWNFLGVVTSSGLVAFGIISLLPVELILQVGSKAGSPWFLPRWLPPSSGT